MATAVERPAEFASGKEESVVLESTSRGEECSGVENVSGMAISSNEELAPEGVTDPECLEITEQDRKNCETHLDPAPEAVIQEQGELSGGVADREIPGEDCVTDQPNDCAQPSTTDESKDKKDSEEGKMHERQRRPRSGRGALMKELASLNLPDGIILVKDKRYSGYHCTYCNCVLRSLATMRAHIGGKWHRRTLQMRMVNERKKKIATPSKSSGSPSQKILPKEPLKSSLEEFLSTTKASIVGLSYIIETQRPNKKPTFQCNLCEVSCDSSDIQDHISGVKHCLMYSKLVKPAKLAELLAKQMTRAEKNKEIAKLLEELERENGRGEISVKFLQAKSTPDVKQPGRMSNNSRKRGRFGNRPGDRARGSGITPAFRASIQRGRNSLVATRNAQRLQQKRRNDGTSPAKKRQLLERDFQARMQYDMQGAQNDFFPGRWGMGNKPMDMFPYKNDAGFYSNYPNLYRDSYGERAYNRRYMNEPFNGRFSSREKYDGRQSYWNDRHDNYTSNMSRSYNDKPASRNEGYSKGSVSHISALKRLAGFNVTNEDDAGVVINAINSLTNSVMNYKLRDLSQPVQQLLQKSLKSNNLTSLLDLPDKNDGGSSRDRYGGRSSKMDQNWGINQIAKPKNWLF